MTGFRLWQIAGWTMLHYFWAGMALGAAALIARQRLRSAQPGVRYWFALGSLLLLSIAPAGIAVVVAQNIPPVPRDKPLTVNFTIRPEVMPIEEIRPVIAAGDTHMSVPPANFSDHPAKSAETPSNERFLAALNLAAIFLPWLWVFGAPLSFVMTTAGLFGAERLRRQSRPLEDARITELCRKLASSLKISYRVSMAVCDRIASPVLVGVLRPMILFPATALAGWDPQQLEMVLLHELAHVRRYDNLVNLLQRIVESLLFFQPMVWIISRWVRREREHCCDEFVVARTLQPCAYAEILLTLAETVSRSRLRSSLFAPSQAVSSMAERPLVARIRRILKREEQSLQVSRKAVALVFLCLLMVSTIGGGFFLLSSRADDSPTASTNDKTSAVETQSSKTPAETSAPRNVGTSDNSAGGVKPKWKIVNKNDSGLYGGLMLAMPRDIKIEKNASFGLLPSYEILAQKAVLAKLNLTAEQESKIFEIPTKYHADMGDYFRTSQSKDASQDRQKKTYAQWMQEEQKVIQKWVEEILEPEQVRALNELLDSKIAYDRLIWPPNRQSFHFTKEQDDRIHALDEEAENRCKQNNEKTTEKLMAVLTPEQRILLREVAPGPLAAGYYGLITAKVEGENVPLEVITLDPYPDFSEEKVQQDLQLTENQKQQVQNILGGCSSATDKLVREQLKLSLEERERVKQMLRQMPRNSSAQTSSDPAVYRERVMNERKECWATFQEHPLVKISVELRKQFESLLTPEQRTAYRDMAVHNIASSVLYDSITWDQIHATDEQQASLYRITNESLVYYAQFQLEWGAKLLKLLTPEQRKMLQQPMEEK